MIIRSTIDSECQGHLYYTYNSMGREYKEYLPKHRTRLSEYNADMLIKELLSDPTVKTVYLYKITYSDGRISLIANPNNPLGPFNCEDSEKT